MTKSKPCIKLILKTEKKSSYDAIANIQQHLNAVPKTYAGDIKQLFNTYMHKIGPRRPKHYIFGEHFYAKKARKLRFHVFLHFNGRKHMKLSFYRKWIEFTRSCEFVAI